MYGRPQGDLSRECRSSSLGTGVPSPRAFSAAKNREDDKLFPRTCAKRRACHEDGAILFSAGETLFPPLRGDTGGAAGGGTGGAAGGAAGGGTGGAAGGAQGRA